MDRRKLELYKGEAETELVSNILDFWMRYVLDFESEGFNGRVSSDGTPDPKADKGVLMAARSLWTFSRAYNALKDPEYLKSAGLLYDYIEKHFIDRENGGVYWLLDSEGRPKDTEKKIYGQAFAIYGMAEYAKASGTKGPLNKALEIFELCEKHGRDLEYGGYIESRLADWSPNPVMKLSSREPEAPKSMNTNLHVMEALACLYHHFPSEKLKEALLSEIKVFRDKIALSSGHLGMFFSMDWRLLSDHISYGHDIEASWLLDEAAGISGDAALSADCGKSALLLAETALKEAFDSDGGIICEGNANGPILPHFKEWWAQPEGMVGFLNAYQKTGNEIFLEKSLSLWEYSKKMLIRPEGGWYFYVGADGKTDKAKEIAGEWICPYHNGRACIEISERINKLSINNY
ncbi:MAG TPA: AGE family epimerase/isomerase [Candidatus Goldiibacteriota bacterium]|nr:AGE family epimerase/isomerase [Candidatus Goldiibacteriota bacterium]